MFKSIGRNGASEATGQMADESDDNISLTSTIPDPYDSENEYVVKDVLTEHFHKDKGEMFYLIEWVGFPMHECTWEPGHHLHEELMEAWQETKRKQARGEVKPFDIKIYHDAKAKAEKEKEERHRRRNAKRKKLGLPLTPPFPKKAAVKVVEPDEEMEESSEDEATEDTCLDDDSDVPLASSRSQRKPATVKEISVRKSSASSPKSALSAVPKTRTEVTKSQADTRRPSNPKAAVTDTATTGKKAVPASTSRAQTDRPSATGYQGTAKPVVTRRLTSKSSIGDAPAPAPKSAVPGSSQGIASGPNRPAAVAQRNALTAKRSAATNQPTGNIFTGGKVKKPRASLGEAMSDASKDPKHFAKHRFRRLAEKRARDMEDLAPDPSKLVLLDISKGLSVIKKPVKEPLPTPTASREDTQAGKGPSIIQGGPTTKAPAALKKPSKEVRFDDATSQKDTPTRNDSSISQGSSILKKKRKAVRFLAESDDDETPLVQEPEPMDVDVDVIATSPPAVPPEDSTARARPRSPPPEGGISKKLSLAAYRSKALVQSAEKKLVLGGTKPVQVTFNGLPRDPLNPWLEYFLAQETLEFRYTCFAKSLNVLKRVVQGPISGGTIVSKDSESSLEAAADYLRTGLLGLYCPHREYSVIIYPTRCDEWKQELNTADLFKEDPSSPSGVALRYFIYRPQPDFEQLVRPLNFPPPTGTTGPKTAAPQDDRELLMKRLFKFTYAELLPRDPNPPTVHSFFLAFPPSRHSTMMSLCHWLRACNPYCRIYTSLTVGCWAAFKAAAEQEPGVVILHELLAWSLYRFVGLSQRLMASKADRYWCFSEPVQLQPLYPSISLPTETPTVPGDMRLSQLFPRRTAILLTPSFLVSEPKRAYEFFDWFLSGHADGHELRLVTAWNIHEYLLDLAVEKVQARRDLLNSSPDVKSALFLHANLRGLTQADCKNRDNAAILARELHHLRSARCGPYGVEEEQSPLVYVDQSIDANDEQSLVNWFGWWAILRADRFREFHVVGSSNSIGFTGSRKGERIIRIPKYSEVTLNDPDGVLEVIQQRDDEEPEQPPPPPPPPPPNAEQRLANANAEPAAAAAGNSNASGNMRVVVPGAERPPPRGPSWTFHSDLLVSDDGWTIADYLGRFKGGHQWTCYRFPISGVESHGPGFEGIFPWFNFSFSFVMPTIRSKKHAGFNTYIGFFYTLEEDDGVQRPFTQHRRERQRNPWLAVYRPVNPHIKPYRDSEIIIWDPAAKTKWPGDRQPEERELNGVQREVIKFIREHGDKKNPRTRLHQVWLGGHDVPKECESSKSPMDTTIKFLGLMVEDIKTYLPGPEVLMPRRGFKKVMLEETRVKERERTRERERERDEDRMDIDDPPAKDKKKDKDEDDEEDRDDDREERMIFHPPRGRKLPPGQRTACTNRLYEMAEAANRARASRRDRESRAAAISSSRWDLPAKPGSSRDDGRRDIWGREDSGREGGADVIADRMDRLPVPPGMMKYAFPPTLQWYELQRQEGRAHEHLNVDAWENIFNHFRIGVSTSANSGLATAQATPDPTHPTPGSRGEREVQIKKEPADADGGGSGGSDRATIRMDASRQASADTFHSAMSF